LELVKCSGVNSKTPADQFPCFMTNRWSTRLPCLTLPTPIQAKSFSVPRYYGFRFDDQQHCAPLFPKTRNDRPKQTVCCSETCALLLSLQHRQLMTKRKNFDLQTCPRPETRPLHKKQRVGNWVHGHWRQPSDSPDFNYLKGRWSF